jgi:hypothetical protein
MARHRRIADLANEHDYNYLANRVNANLQDGLFRNLFVGNSLRNQTKYVLHS